MLQISPFGKSVLGVYAIIVGLIMVIFHKQVKQMNDYWHEHFPLVLRPTGRLLTVLIILFGALSILSGVALLSLAFVQQ